MIDVRDLADWLLRLAAGEAHGIVNAMGEPVLFPRHIEATRSIGGHTGPLVLAS